jgi:hypothetical protein
MRVQLMLIVVFGFMLAAPPSAHGLLDATEVWADFLAADDPVRCDRIGVTVMPWPGSDYQDQSRNRSLEGRTGWDIAETPQHRFEACSSEITMSALCNVAYMPEGATRDVLQCSFRIIDREGNFRLPTDAFDLKHHGGITKGMISAVSFDVPQVLTPANYRNREPGSHFLFVQFPGVMVDGDSDYPMWLIYTNDSSHDNLAFLIVPEPIIE